MSTRRVIQTFKTPVTLIVLLLILVLGGWWGFKNALKPIPTPPPPPCVTQNVAGQLKSEQVTVNVFNGGTRRGLASAIGNNLKTKGFILSRVENVPDRVTVTIVRGSKADNPEVKLVAGFFKDALIEADERPDNTVDVLVGNDFPDDGWVDGAPTTIAVPGNVVCLPAPDTPTATAKKS